MIIKKTPDPRESNRKTSRLHIEHTNWVSFMESIKRKIGRVGKKNKWSRRNNSVERYGIQ
jgi:hypothetical protein